MEGIAQRPLGHGQAGGTDHLSGSLFQRPATLSVKKRILVPSVNLPWCSSEPFPRVLSLHPRRRAQHLPLTSPPREAVESGEVGQGNTSLWAKKTGWGPKNEVSGEWAGCLKRLSSSSPPGLCGGNSSL